MNRLVQKYIIRECALKYRYKGLEYYINRGVEIHHDSIDYGKIVYDCVEQKKFNQLKSDQYNTIKLLLENYPKTDKKDVYLGKTLLHCTKLNNGKIVDLLINHPNCDINYIEKDGYSVMSMAIKYYYMDIIKTLIVHPEFDPNLKNESDKPLIFYIIDKSFESQETIFKQICKHPKFNINVQDSCGHTLLHHLCSKGYDFASIVQQHGADPNIQNNSGNLSIHIAGHLTEQTVQLLIDETENINTQNNNNETPLIFDAKYTKDLSYLQLKLIENGCDLYIKDNNNKTYFDYICYRDYIIKFLNIRFKKSLLYQCTLFVKNHKYFYKKDSLTSLPRDIRKFIL